VLSHFPKPHKELDLLDEGAIRSAMDPIEAMQLQGLEVCLEIDSTNQRLLDYARKGLQGPLGCLAEYQTAGRGRRGNIWQSPPSSGLCLSLLRTFDQDPKSMVGLSLAVGTTVAKVLEECGVPKVGLKWPNDLYWAGRKLGGLLIDVLGQPDGPTRCVIGIGINVCIPSGTVLPIDQPSTDLAATHWKPLPRNHLAAALLSGLLRTAHQFEAEGLSPFLESWQRRDVLMKQSLTVQLPNGQVMEGIGAGIHSDGTLRIQSGQEILYLTAGEITVRMTKGV